MEKTISSKDFALVPENEGYWLVKKDDYRKAIFINYRYLLDLYRSVLRVVKGEDISPIGQFEIASNGKVCRLVCTEGSDELRFDNEQIEDLLDCVAQAVEQCKEAADR